MLVHLLYFYFSVVGCISTILCCAFNTSFFLSFFSFSSPSFFFQIDWNFKLLIPFLSLPMLSECTYSCLSLTVGGLMPESMDGTTIWGCSCPVVGPLLSAGPVSRNSTKFVITSYLDPWVWNHTERRLSVYWKKSTFKWTHTVKSLLFKSHYALGIILGILKGKIPWRKEWLLTPVFLPGEFHDRGAWQATVHEVAKNQARLRK